MPAAHTSYPHAPPFLISWHCENSGFFFVHAIHATYALFYYALSHFKVSQSPLIRSYASVFANATKYNNINNNSKIFILPMRMQIK